ncbi:hypothetical protein M422DRAFT_26696 [Sphaerobolus stellatus SS14]|nr:hypothetical protein M422DRAFT_26696 [Sphaerobolus stellatus SS14]
MAGIVRGAFLSKIPSARGREIVLDILKSAPKPLLIRDIFQQVHAKFPDAKTDVKLQEGHVVNAFRNSGRNPFESKFPPPFPDHPIRSVKYLRSIILPDLQKKHLATKVHAPREPTPQELEIKKQKKTKKSAVKVVINRKGLVDEWRWTLDQPKTQKEIIHDVLRIEKAKEGQERWKKKKLEKAKKVAFLEEWGHLNVRRQRARPKKLARTEALAAIVAEAREEGRRLASI